MNPLNQTHITFNNFSWSALSVIIVLTAIIGLMTYRSLRRGGGVTWTLLLLCLRLIAVAVVGCLILEPQIVRRRGEYMQGRVAVLHDRSASMGMPAGAERETRQDVISATMRPLLNDLEEELNLEYFAFSDEVRDSSRQDVLAEESGSGGETDILGALGQVARKHEVEPFRGVIVLSDGRDTVIPSEDGMPPAGFVEQVLEDLDVPVYVMYPANADGIRDVGISEVRAPRLAFAGKQWTAQVDLETIGITEGRLNVMLRRGDSIVDVERVRMEPGQSTYSVELSFRPVRTGRQLLSLEVETNADGAYEENNRTGLVVSVVRDRIRVLQVAGSPSSDVRFLRRTLKKMPIADLVSFYILRDRQDDPGRPTSRS